MVASLDSPARQSLLRRIARGARNGFVVVFVSWHLFFLVFRGGLDLDYSGITDWLRRQAAWPVIEPVFTPIDRASAVYGSWLGVEQGWSLFGGPVARGAKFLAVRIEFTDGSAAWVYSDNEPDPTNFFRYGGWRQRKLEDYLAYATPDKVRASEEQSLWAAHARWGLSRWRAAHPADVRTPRRLVLVARWIAFPLPDRDPAVFREIEENEIIAFTPEGKLE